MKEMQYQCSKETRQKLIDAIIRLAQQKRYENITVQEICRSAGVSNGSFYHQFGTKDELVMAAYQNIDGLLTEEFVAGNRRLPPFQALDRLLRSYLSYIQQRVGLIIAQYYQVLLNHPTRSRYSLDRPYCLEIRHILDQARREELIAESEDSEFLTAAIMRLMRGLLFDWVIRGGQCDLMERYESEFQIFTRGICTRDRRGG